MTNIVWNSWRDKLRDASFRGVDFKVLTATTEGGRRTHLHQYPFNDVPYLEDFGKDAGMYRIEAYVVQNVDNNWDYFTERDLLKSALEEGGPGQFVHPFLGSLWVGVQGKYQLKESFAEGGIARFTITFVDAGESQQPSYIGLGQKVNAPCDAAQISVWNEFAAKVQTTNELAHVVLDAVAQAQAHVSAIQNSLQIPQVILSSAITSAISMASTVRSTIETVINQPALFAATMKILPSIYATLIPTPNNAMYDAVFNSDKPPTPYELYNAQFSVMRAALASTTFDAGAASIIVGTADQQVIKDNRALITDAARTSSLIEAMRVIDALDFPSYDDAVLVRELLTDAFDLVMIDIGNGSNNDALYEVLEGLRPTMISNITNKGANLPVLRGVPVPADVTPSLVLAKQLYGDIGREQEIIDRNRYVCRHPGFPLSGNDLLVMSE